MLLLRFLVTSRHGYGCPVAMIMLSYAKPDGRKNTVSHFVESGVNTDMARVLHIIHRVLHNATPNFFGKIG